MAKKLDPKEIVDGEGHISIVNKGSIKKIQNPEVRIKESEEMRIAEWVNYTIIVIFNIC